MSKNTSTKKVAIFVLLGILFGLATTYSTPGQWGILSSQYSLNPLSNFAFGFVYGLIAAFYLSRLNWKFVVGGGIAFGLFAFLLQQPSNQLLFNSLVLGIFLMAFDWVFENLGAKFEYWYSKRSTFFVKAVPIEVMLGAIGGGFGWALLMPRTFNLFYILLVSLIVGAGGALGENSLGKIKRMTYGNGWTWVHAVVSYFLVWLLLALVWYFIIL